MRYFYLVSLGCPKNRVDSEVAVASLLDSGWAAVDDPEQAELFIVNTCGFIEDARAESVETLLELAEVKKRKPGARLVAMGCLSQFVTTQIQEQMPEVDLVAGTGAVGRLTDLLDSGQKLDVVGETFLPQTASRRILSQSPAFAYLKVADGCSRSCSFCTIPLFKGPFLSRPVDAIVDEAKMLADQGVKEVVLVAQDLTQYGAPGRKSLMRLLQRLERNSNVPWIRLMYLYPEGIDRSLLELVSAGGRLLPYLDIPLQHADDRILRLMKRGTTNRKIRELLSTVRTNFPSVTLRTTFIVGFPGEDEQAFSTLLDAVNEFRFDHMGVFSYSFEPDTASASLPDHLQQRTKEARRKKLMMAQARIAKASKAKSVGTVATVLVEGTSPDSDLVHVGRLASQAPEVDGQVFLDLYEGDVGHFVEARILKATAYDYHARPVDADG